MVVTKDKEMDKDQKKKVEESVVQKQCENIIDNIKLS